MWVYNSLKHPTSQDQSLKRKDKRSYCSQNLVNHEGILLLINQVHTISKKKNRIKTTKFEGSNKFNTHTYIYINIYIYVCMYRYKIEINCFSIA